MNATVGEGLVQLPRDHVQTIRALSAYCYACAALGVAPVDDADAYVIRGNYVDHYVELHGPHGRLARISHGLNVMDIELDHGRTGTVCFDRPAIHELDFERVRHCIVSPVEGWHARAEEITPPFLQGRPLEEHAAVAVG